MPSTFSPNLHLELQATGENPGLWGQNLNNNVLSIIDSAMGGVLSLPLTNVDVTLNTAQTQVNYILLTGALTGNVNITFPQIGRAYSVKNATTGSFTVTFKTSAVGGQTLVVPRGWSGVVVLTGTDVVAITPLPDAMKWQSRGIGEYYFVNTATTGVDIPPSSTTDTVWIELTSGLTGPGGFNNGKLTSESVTGSGPLTLATAVISYAASSMNGQTIRLLNTEGRSLRPSTSPGTIQADAFQNFTGAANLRRLVGGQSLVTGFSGAFVLNAASGPGQARLDAGGADVLSTDVLNINPASASGTRTDDETRIKNLGVKTYMRIA